MLSDFLKLDSWLSNRPDELRERHNPLYHIGQTSPFSSYSFPE